MDISRVRLAFQKKWNFSFRTNSSIDLSQAYYSLQQESLNSDDMLLYVTSQIRPVIEGHVIEAEGQAWIVFQMFKEVVNQSLYEFRLYPVFDQVMLKQLGVASNDLGLVPVDGPSIGIIADCFIEEYSQKERTVPTKQPVESYQKSFIIAAEQVPDISTGYDLYYKGEKYKIESLENTYGIIRVRATKDL